MLNTSEPAAAHEELTGQMVAVLQSLFSGHTVASAAETHSITERTIRNWQRKPAFCRRLQEGRDLLLQETLTQLSVVAGEALRTLADICQDSYQPAAARVAAAGKLLDLLLRHSPENGTTQAVAQSSTAIFVGAPSGAAPSTGVVTIDVPGPSREGAPSLPAALPAASLEPPRSLDFPSNGAGDRKGAERIGNAAPGAGSITFVEPVGPPPPIGKLFHPIHISGSPLLLSPAREADEKLDAIRRSNYRSRNAVAGRASREPRPG